MHTKLTQKQQRYAQFLFEGCSQREAYVKAGYSANMAVTMIDRNACELAKSTKVSARLAELRKKAEDASVMTVVERKQRLSEIARARLTDYQQHGADGGWINVGPESPNTAALSEIVSTTKYDDNGASPTVISRLRLHNPVQAIAELNKMDHVYEVSESPQITVQTCVFVLPDGTRVLPGQLANVSDINKLPPGGGRACGGDH